MTKCDFCTKFHNGKCFWSNALLASTDCEKAINSMTKALRNIDIMKGKKNE